MTDCYNTDYYIVKCLKAYRQPMSSECYCSLGGQGC